MTVRILTGDCREILKTLADGSVNTCVTSPPYLGLRDYHVDGQVGMEASPDEYVAELVAIFREVRRVLRDDATLWLNLGDTYSGGGHGGGGSYSSERTNWRDMPPRSGQRVAIAGCKPKDMVGIPWLVAFALRTDGWYLRQDIIWSKPNPMPESVTDRCTKAHEYLFLLSKSGKYYYDIDAIREPFADASIERLRQDIANQQGSDRVPGKTNGRMKAVGLNANRSSYRPGSASNMNEGEHVAKSDAGLPLNERGRNRRSVWEVATQPFSLAHFATFPPALIEPCILAGCPRGGVVLDPFLGAGTTAMVADRLGRDCIGIELNSSYAELASERIKRDGGMFSRVEMLRDGERYIPTLPSNDTICTTSSDSQEHEISNIDKGLYDGH